MRVIGGEFRSRKLVGFEGERVRPTADRTRESLFNILRIKPNARFLDAFCGSGAVGIEAISRGAESTFLDCDEKSAKIAEENFARLGISAKVTRVRAEDFLARTEEKFDVIFLDPPYASDSGKKALEIIGARGVLAENGVAVYEHEEPFAGEISKLIAYDERRYGRAVLTFFKAKGE
ncbi:MAG: 16S rRNA (guanine(966)-N(2))-methyltransferase RsmD [Bacillota bacterium]|nr:MAG: 16S rRNA (guanine(966)-N(2))-methyltransferase RsmD [Bacillota bacterium]